MGLSLTIQDFKRIVIYPKAVITGLINQLILLPIIGFGLVWLFPVKPEIAVGIMILAACPGGATSNLITHLSKGDTALSVTLTAISSILTILTIPFIVQFALLHFMGQEKQIVLNIPQVIGQLFVITIIPVSVGMLIKSKKPSFAAKMDKPVKRASAVVLAIVILGIILKEKNNVLSYFEQAGVLALLLNLSSLFIGYFTAKTVMRLKIRQSISIAVESGIQNGTLAIAIATITIGINELAISGAIYSLIMLFTGVCIVFLSGYLRPEEKAVPIS